MSKIRRINKSSFCEECNHPSDHYWTCSQAGMEKGWAFGTTPLWRFLQDITILLKKILRILDTAEDLLVFEVSIRCISGEDEWEDRHHYIAQTASQVRTYMNEYMKDYWGKDTVIEDGKYWSSSGNHCAKVPTIVAMRNKACTNVLTGKTQYYNVIVKEEEN